METFFKELFEYNYHFNQKLAEVFVAQAEKTSEKSVKLFSHVLNAHHIWNSRIENKAQTFGVWDIHAADDFEQINQTNYEHSIYILENVDLNSISYYKNSKGQSFQNKVGDMLFHVINHSTYHRGQIASEFRQNGMGPLVTDYIFYKR